MKKLFPAVLAAFLIVVLTACAGKSDIAGPEDIKDKRVGVIVGSVSAAVASRLDPDMDLVLCDTAASLKEALKSGRADCAIADKSVVDELTGFLSSFQTTEDPYARVEYAIAVSADNTLMLEKLNATLNALKSSGRLREITDAVRDMAGAEFSDGSGDSLVTVAVVPDLFPFAYYDENGSLAGIEIDLTRALCGELGLTAVFMPVESDMLLYMAQSGKCAFAIGRLTPGEDEGLLYTASYIDSTQYIIIKK